MAPVRELQTTASVVSTSVSQEQEGVLPSPGEAGVVTARVGLLPALPEASRGWHLGSVEAAMEQRAVALAEEAPGL